MAYATTKEAFIDRVRQVFHEVEMLPQAKIDGMILEPEFREAFDYVMANKDDRAAMSALFKMAFMLIKEAAREAMIAHIEQRYDMLKRSKDTLDDHFLG